MSNDSPAKAPTEPTGEDSVLYWEWIAAMCGYVGSVIPGEDEPEYDHPCVGDEWKETTLREWKEHEMASETRAALEHLLTKLRWPQSVPGTAFFAWERLKFARLMAKALATAPKGNRQSGVLTNPKGTVYKTIRWLTIDVYDANHFSRHRWSEEKPPGYW